MSAERSHFSKLTEHLSESQLGGAAGQGPVAGYQESRERESCGADFREWKKAKLAVQGAVRPKSVRGAMAAVGSQRALGGETIRTNSAAVMQGEYPRRNGHQLGALRRLR